MLYILHLDSSYFINTLYEMSQSSKEKASDMVLISGFLYLYLGTICFLELWVKWKEKQEQLALAV